MQAPGGAPTTIPAPGVRSNDSIPCGQAATIRVVSNPTAGSVTLNKDGSFTYVPTPTSTPVTDSFQYEINCNGMVSKATVTLPPFPSTSL